MPNNLSLDYYSASNPNLWIETTSIHNGTITTRESITTIINRNATDEFIKEWNEKSKQPHVYKQYDTPNG